MGVEFLIDERVLLFLDTNTRACINRINRSGVSWTKYVNERNFETFKKRVEARLFQDMPHINFNITGTPYSLCVGSIHYDFSGKTPSWERLITSMQEPFIGIPKFPDLRFARHYKKYLTVWKDGNKLTSIKQSDATVEALEQYSDYRQLPAIFVLKN